MHPRVCLKLQRITVGPFILELERWATTYALKHQICHAEATKYRCSGPPLLLAPYVRYRALGATIRNETRNV